MGEQLADLLNDAIEERINDDDTEEEDRDDVRGLITEGSGVQEDTIRNILNGDIQCPPPARIPPLADDLPVTQTEIEDALVEDGCEEFESSTGVPSYKFLAKRYDRTI